jgi:hypothetical protein
MDLFCKHPVTGDMAVLNSLADIFQFVPNDDWAVEVDADG